jgi:hypothetical protein
VRKSYDPRGDNRSEAADGHTSFAYTVLVDHSAALKCGAKLKHRMGKQERYVPSIICCLGIKSRMGTRLHNALIKIRKYTS